MRAFVTPPAAPNSSPTAPQELPTVQASLHTVDVPTLPLDPVAPPVAAATPMVRPTAYALASDRSKPAVRPTPAALIYDPGVSVPQELKMLIGAPVRVQVRVNVDATGRVTRAEAVRDGHVHGLLLSAATNAALRCRFRPARIGDTPIPSEVTVSFQVHP